MDLIVTLVVLAVLPHLICKLTSKVNIPHVIGLIISGLIIGIPPVREYLIEPHSDLVFKLGDIALFCLMFLAGMKSSLKEIYYETKDETIIALFAAVIPFLLGFLVFKLLGFSLLISIIVGVCMTITSEATKAEELLDLRKIKSKVGSAMLASGILDDLIGLIIFILATSALAIVPINDYLLLLGVLVSFFVGVMVQRKAKKIEKIADVNNLFKLIIPFFFISMGMYFNFESLIVNPTLLLLIIVVAVVGKFVSVFLAKPFTTFSWAQTKLIGWAMNSRGAMELAIAVIALRNGLIPTDLYSSIIIMTLITTILFPFVLVNAIKKNRKIMN